MMGGTIVNENNNKTSISSTDLEQNTLDAALSAHGFETLASRVNITVKSYRRLNHDPDGISAKAVIDGITRAGVLTDDSSKQVKSVTFESYQDKDERTEIIIEDVEDD